MHRAMLAASLKASVAWCAPLVLASACCLSAPITTDDAVIGSMPTSKHSRMTREQPILANQRIQDSAQWGLGREQGCQGILHDGAWTTTDVHCCAKLFVQAIASGCQCGFLAELLLYNLLRQVVTLSTSCAWNAVWAAVGRTCTAEARLHTLVRWTCHHGLAS